MEGNMGRLTIAGLIAALGTFVVVAAAQVSTPPVPGVTPAPPAQPRYSYWPALGTNGPVVTEWYSDVPWTQKLGTYRGNEIDEALVLPYGALVALGRNCASYTPERCMIETGINNMLGISRTDIPYDPANSL